MRTESEESGRLGGRPHGGARLVLTTGVLLGVVYLGFKLWREAWMVGLDFRVYRAAAATALSSGDVYGHSPVGIPGMTFRYPPVVLVALLPSVAIPWEPGYAVHTLATVAAGGVLAWILTGVVTEHGVTLTRVDRALVFGFVVASVHAMPSVVFGQVNHFVALGLAAGLYWLDDGRDRRAGVALGLAALPKVFPGAVGLWLVRRRAGRAIAAAVTTGVSLLGVGAVLFGPTTTRNWVIGELTDRLAAGAFAGGLPPAAPYVTLRRPLSVLASGVNPRLYGAGALLLVAPAVAYLWLDVTGPTARLVAIFGFLAGLLVVVPSYPLYLVFFYYPFVPLLYLLEGPGRRPFLVGGLLTAVPLRLDSLGTALSILPVGDSLRAAVIEATQPVMTFATPPLWGIGLMIVGCLLWTESFRAADSRGTAPGE